MKITGGESPIENWFCIYLMRAFNDVEVVYRKLNDFDSETGIISVVLSTQKDEITLD